MQDAAVAAGADVAIAVDDRGAVVITGDDTGFGELATGRVIARARN